MRGLSIACRLFLAMVVFSIAGSAFSKLTGLSPGWIAPISAMLTLLVGFWAILGPILADGGPKALAAAGLVLLLGLVSEVIGIYTGLPFGNYEYTDRWWPTVVLPGGHSFPLLVPLAWFLVAGASYLVARRLVPRASILAGSLLAAAVDLAMEPVMTQRLGFWRWLTPGPLPGGAPLLNPVGWLLTSLLASWILSQATDEVSTKEPAVILCAYVLLVVAIGALR